MSFKKFINKSSDNHSPTQYWPSSI